MNPNLICPKCGAAKWIGGVHTPFHINESGLSLETGNEFDEQRGITCEDCGYMAQETDTIYKYALEQLGSEKS